MVTGKSVHLVKRDLTILLSMAYVSCIFQSKDGCIYVWETASRQSKEEGPCLPACHFLKGERWVDEFGKLEDHILRHHMEPERVPFFCRLCKFKCMRRDQLVRHVSHYARHVTMAASRQIVDHTPWLVASSNPYRVTEMDYRKFTQDESLNFFLEKQKQLPLSSVVNKIAAGTLERDISTETLNAGFISMPTGGDVQPSGSSGHVTELSTAVISASDQWATYPLPVNTTLQTPVRTIMPYT